MDRYLDLLEQIKKHETITLWGHELPDGDCYGCIMAFKDILLSAFPDKKVYGFTKGKEEFYPFIGTPDDSSELEISSSLAILLDVGTLNRVSSKRIIEVKDIAKIDHHPDPTEGEDFPYFPSIIDTTRIACAELLFDIVTALGLPLTEKAANGLYLGLSTDSGRFVYYGTSKHTFEVAASLIRGGADPKRIFGILDKKDPNVVKFVEYIRSRTLLNNGVAFCYVSHKEYVDRNVPYEVASGLVSSIGNVHECKAFCLFTEDDYGNIRGELRSNKKMDVSKVARFYGGGGHTFASGLKIEVGFETTPDDVVFTLSREKGL